MSLPLETRIAATQRILGHLFELRKSIEQSETNPPLERDYELSLLGVHISIVERDAAFLAEEQLESQKSTMNEKAYQSKKAQIIDRKIAAGDSLWHYTCKKARLSSHDDLGAIALLKPGPALVMGETVLTFYKSFDGLTKHATNGPKSCERTPRTTITLGLAKTKCGCGAMPPDVSMYRTGSDAHISFLTSSATTRSDTSCLGTDGMSWTRKQTP